MEQRQIVTDNKNRVAILAAWNDRVAERRSDGFNTPVLSAQLVFSEGKAYRVTTPSANNPAAVIEEIIQF